MTLVIVSGLNRLIKATERPDAPILSMRIQIKTTERVDDQVMMPKDVVRP